MSNRNIIIILTLLLLALGGYYFYTKQSKVSEEKLLEIQVPGAKLEVNVQETEQDEEGKQ